MDVQDVRALALSLPGVEESTSYGTLAFKVRKKLLLRMLDDDHRCVVRVPQQEREILLQARPEVFSVTPHYQNHDAVIVDLKAADPEELLELIESAWRVRASKKLLAELDRRQRGDLP